MSIRTLSILGLRGFQGQQDVEFAEPTGTAGAGLTLLVGPNNGGKSTVIEALRALSGRKEQSFSTGKRNQAAGDRVVITATDATGGVHELRSLTAGSSEAEFTGSEALGRLYVLPSRRYFSPFFGKGLQGRQDYIQNVPFPSIRGTALDQFASRLFNIQRDPDNKNMFNNVLREIVDPLPEWTIDLNDSGQYFLKFKAGAASHSSDGLGEGLVSCLFIVDAIYDAGENDVIVIDEPELSLHPMYQRRLAGLLGEYSRTRQIIIATHSPYFVDLTNIVSGAKLARVHKGDCGSLISPLTSQSVQGLAPFLQNRNNPHILGLDAREVFFLEDKIILVEGQDDVAGYREIASQLGKSFAGHFFGWGAGGADNIAAIAAMLKDLSFKKVIALFDSNKSAAADAFARKFPDYGHFVVPAEDVRTKSARSAGAQIEGLLDEHYNLRQQYVRETAQLIEDVNAALR